MKNIGKTSYIAKIAVLGVLAFVIMLLEFPLPIFPPFLKMDFSDIVPLIGALAMGPIAGMFIEFVKCLLHWIFASTTAGIGDIANFIVGSAYVLTAGFIYKKKRTRAGAVLALICATIVMVLAGAVSNYFIMLPFYAAAFFKDAGGMNAIIEISAAVIPPIDSKFTLVLYAMCPFNLLKGLIIMVITMPIYKKVSPLLHREIAHHRKTA